MNPDKILADLNDRQKEAAGQTRGAVLVVAGPGSGKTKALTHHIAYLIATGVSPENILAVTFTNKAAEEMRGRVNQLLSLTSLMSLRSADSEAAKRLKLNNPFNSLTPFIGTFHSFAAFVLRREAGLAGYKRHFTIYDESDSLGLIKEVMKELELDPKNFPPGMIAAVISNLKNDLVSSDEYAGRGESELFPRTVALVYENYQRRLLFANAMDFDDLIFHVTRLFRKNGEALARWQKRFHHIHIDEFQDTNTAQYELVRLLGREHESLFVIGDDSQAIYGWRQADYRNILNFERDWPEAKVVLLEENYRSSPEILKAANHLIAKNKKQKEKTLWTKNPSGPWPEVWASSHERDEAERIAEEILALARDGASFSETAVLYRTNAQSRVLEETMIYHEIPYVIVGGIKFWQRREIKDLTAYLRYLVNADDRAAEKRIINVPPRGIGPKTFLAYLSGETAGLAARDQKKIAEFKSVITELREGLGGKTLAEFLRFLISAISYEKYLADLGPDGEARVENAKELVSVARKYDYLAMPEAAAKLLEDIALVSEQDEIRENDERVKLMTLHAAKGLEFKAVFMAGLEEGVLPHAKSIQNGLAELEEERRLCYVGMTRAKERLYLSWALKRTVFGETQVNMPSRFLRELPPEVLEQNETDSDDILIVEE